MDLRDLDRSALDQAGGFIAAVTADDLARPTPCAGWTLDVLLRHMVSHNHGFAAAARGEAAQRAVWEDASLGNDPYQTYQDSAAAVTAAFGAPDVFERKLDVYGYGVFPAPTAIS